MRKILGVLMAAALLSVSLPAFGEGGVSGPVARKRTPSGAGAAAAERDSEIQRYAIPYGRHRQARRAASPLPTLENAHSFIAPLPKSGHNYLEDFAGR